MNRRTLSVGLAAIGIVALIAVVAFIFVRSGNNDSPAPPAAASEPPDQEECPSVRR